MRVTHDRGVYTERRRGRMVVEVVGRADLALGVENRVRGGGGGVRRLIPSPYFNLKCQHIVL